LIWDGEPFRSADKPSTQSKRGGVSGVSFNEGAEPESRPFLYPVFTAKVTTKKRLQPVLRAFPRPSAGLSADCALRTRACLQGKFPKVRLHRDGLPSPLQQPTLHTRPCGGVRDGSVLPVRIDVWRPGIGSQPLASGHEDLFDSKPCRLTSDPLHTCEP